MYAICLSNSEIVSGAEKRALKLFNELNMQGIPCKLIVSKKVFNLFYNGGYKQYLTHNYIIVDTQWLISFRNSRLGRSNKFFLFGKYTGLNRIILTIYCFQFSRVAKSNGISVLHIFLDLELAQFMKKNKCISKIIFEITSPDYVKRLSQESLNLENIDHFNAVSDSVYLSAVNFINKSKLSQAPIPFFNPIEYEVNDNSIFEQKENVIIFAHRLIPRKNGILFAKVVKKFLENNLNWTIKIYGKGPESKEIKKILREEIIARRVITGYQTKIISELARSKIFVSLIEPDNYPSQSVLEAMYTGNALLLSDTGYTKEKFLDRNGLLCDLSFDEILFTLTELARNIDLELFGRNSIKLLHNRKKKKIYLDYISHIYKLQNI